MGDSLANLEVAKELVAVVDLDDQLIGQRLVALGHHFEIAVGGNAIEIRQRHLRERCELDFAGLERRGGACTVRQNPEDELVELRLAFTPIVFIACQPVVLSGLVLGEHEWTGADWLVVGRIGSNVGAFIQMLGQDAADYRKSVPDQLQRGGFGELEHGRQIVRRFH